MIEALARRGFVSAQRFRVEPGQSRRASHGYVALYELETDDPEQALADLWAALAEGQFTPSDAIDGKTFVALSCAPITEKLSAAAAASR